MIIVAKYYTDTTFNTEIDRVSCLVWMTQNQCLWVSKSLGLSSMVATFRQVGKLWQTCTGYILYKQYTIIENNFNCGSICTMVSVDIHSDAHPLILAYTCTTIMILLNHSSVHFQCCNLPNKLFIQGGSLST